eukprot:TRINITY_DN75406_c0_g1_i1.p2 TRINITY_DN75406_c0_g1~~TRINITY_DN75406_c0_g1_i1.p2  ORF type:complete len:209 (+),score=53.02 TRINITY_DN75406_c0_g1_i1:57-683(+)
MAAVAVGSSTSSWLLAPALSGVSIQRSLDGMLRELPKPDAEDSWDVDDTVTSYDILAGPDGAVPPPPVAPEVEEEAQQLAQQLAEQLAVTCNNDEMRKIFLEALAKFAPFGQTSEAQQLASAQAAVKVPDALQVVQACSNLHKAKNGSGQCSICLEDIKEGQWSRMLPCLHSLHKKCATKYFKVPGVKACCPVCRHSVARGSTGSAVA